MQLLVVYDNKRTNLFQNMLLLTGIHANRCDKPDNDLGGLAQLVENSQDK